MTGFYKKFFFASVVFLIFTLLNIGDINADWWDRPDTRPSQPSLERELPTLPPEPTTTSIPPPTSVQPTLTIIPTEGVQPTPTVTIAAPPVGGLPSRTPTVTISSGGSGEAASVDDPCAPGKSYTGDYCGWSPGVGGGVSAENRIGGPQVLGLSYTGSLDLDKSDIILLLGILCLLLYTRSKVTKIYQR